MSLVIENEGFSAPLHQVTVYLVLTAESYAPHPLRLNLHSTKVASS